MADKITRDVHIERYFPDVVAPAKEFKTWAASINPEFSLLYEAFWEVYSAAFVFHADAKGIARWEEMLHIYPEEGATLDDRRLAIYLKINYGLPYTERSFQTMLNAFFGEKKVTAAVHPESYTIAFDITPDMLDKTEAIRRYARLILPANLLFIMTQTQEIIHGQYGGSEIRPYRKRMVIRMVGPGYDMELNGWNFHVYTKETDCPAPRMQWTTADGAGWVHVREEVETPAYVQDDGGKPMYIQEA